MTEEQKKAIRQFFGFLFEALSLLKRNDKIFTSVILNFDYFTKKIVDSFEEDVQGFQMERCIRDFQEFVLRLALGDPQLKKEYEESIHTFKGSVFENMQRELMEQSEDVEKHIQDLRDTPFESFINTLDIGDDNEAPLD